MRRTAAYRRLDAVVATIAASILVAACGSPVVTPSASIPASLPPTASPSLGPSASATAPGTATSSPSATASQAPALSGHWEAAGSMALGRGVPRAVLLGDGSVLVVGNDGLGLVRADSLRSEIWKTAGGTWSSGPSLDKPRSEFVALAMKDGRAFVTGGVSAGIIGSDGSQDHHQSFSSSFTFDPQHASAGWTRVALQDHARSGPAAAALLDGRVLVAGGYYLSGRSGFIGPIDPTAAAASRPGACSGGMCPAPPGDVAPPTLVPALATAELYDPASDSWSATGHLRYARVGPAAVTLGDGRVLVVGSALSAEDWNYTQPGVSDHAYDTAEVFDPGTGRFTLTGDLPAVDWSPLAKLGPYPVTPEGITSVGTLIALDDGGALLVGRVTSWSIRDLSLSGTTAATLRFDPGTGKWTQIDQSIYASVVSDNPTPSDEIVHGHSREGASAVRLGDGRVLVAGGSGVQVSDAAELYDPASGSWSTLPSMPAPQRDAAAVLLPDGSVLVVGGQGADPVCDDCTGIPNAVRFVPGS